MRYIAIGGDKRMQGAALAAQRAGWEGEWMQDGNITDAEPCDLILLPWPHSFREEKLVVQPPHRGKEKEAVLRRLPKARLCLHGSGAAAAELAHAADAFDPSEDELFLRRNAQLTAEGAICRAMQRMERALLGSTCLITGYGRIGQELAARLCAMGAFVVVCARSEMQMRASHAVGAHPVPLTEIAQAAAAADLILGTVPATVLDAQALCGVRRDTLILELASEPYGVDMEAATRLGLNISIERGIPGRYAPLEAGAALFEAAQRRLNRQREGV